MTLPQPCGSFLRVDFEQSFATDGGGKFVWRSFIKARKAKHSCFLKNLRKISSSQRDVLIV